MEYADLAAFFDRLEGTTKRLEMTAILVEMLGELAVDEMAPAVRLLQGKVAPDWEGIELGLAEKLVLQVLARAAGLNVKADGIQKATAVYHDTGDLGLAAERLIQRKGGAAQVGLMAFGEPDESPGLRVGEVFDRLLAIAQVQGSGSQDTKQKLLFKLLSDAGPREAKYIVRTVAGRSRLGVADMTFLDALAAWHRGEGVKSVTEMEPEERAAHEDIRRRLERAYDYRSDLALVAHTLARDGLDAVDALGIEVGTPLRPMAAERLKTLPEILEKHSGRSALEYKYDGLRIQAHVPADATAPVRLFSRRMEELTGQFPDVCESLRAAARGIDCIVEGEALALDADGHMLPFQEISRRRGRKTGLGEDARKEASGERGLGQVKAAATMMDEIPVTMFLFDCLAADGEATLAEPYEARRARLFELFEEGGPVRVSTMVVAEDEAEMEAFFRQAVEDGAEGIMCKDPGAPYKAGNRGFDWIKFKTDYTEDLVDTMDLVVIGAFYGRGRRAGWYGALLMAAYDPDRDRFTSLCKLGTGFDDETLKGLKDRFADLVAAERPASVDSDMQPDVWLRPGIVMEVQAAELSLSPTHRTAWGTLRDGAGLAARFPRFSGRWRDDKGPEQATTVEELVGMYRTQGKQS